MKQMPLKKARYYRQHRMLNDLKNDEIYHQKVLDIQVITQGYQNTEITNTVEGITDVDLTQYKRPVMHEYVIYNQGDVITQLSQTKVKPVTGYYATQSISYDQLLALICSYLKDIGETPFGLVDRVMTHWTKLDEVDR